MKIIPNHCAFVAGNAPTPRVFASKIFQKLDAEELATRSGRIIFKQGEETEIQSAPIPQSPADLSAMIYNKMLVQNEIYEKLISFRTNFSGEIRELMAELKILTLAMQNIYRSLSRGQNSPRQTATKPQIRDFCSGVGVASKYIREIMRDVRTLTRMVDNQNTERQLILINLTLQSQHAELQDIKEECR